MPHSTLFAETSTIADNKGPIGDGGKTLVVVGRVARRRMPRPRHQSPRRLFAVYMDGEGCEPTYVLHGRDALRPVFDDLNRYERTTHFNGQSTIVLTGDSATAGSGLCAVST
jgi:hypothetical protein